MKLTNNMFPEKKVVGSVNFTNRIKSIPPDFCKNSYYTGSNRRRKEKLVEENIQNICDVADTVYERSKESDKKL